MIHCKEMWLTLDHVDEKPARNPKIRDKHPPKDKTDILNLFITL